MSIIQQKIEDIQRNKREMVKEIHALLDNDICIDSEQLNLVADLVADLKPVQARLEKLQSQGVEIEKAIAILQEAIAEDLSLWVDVRDRLQPAWLGNSEGPKDEVLRVLYGYHSCSVPLQELSRFLKRSEREILPLLQRLEPDFINSSDDGFQINVNGIRYVEALEAILSEVAKQIDAEGSASEAIALPPTIISDGNGSANLGCAKQKLAKDWAELITLWGCTAEVTKAESFSDKEIKWEVAIANITRSQLETLSKTHTSPHAEVPTPGRKVENLDADIERGHEVWRQPYRLQSPSSDQILDAECLPRDKNLSALILGYLDEADEPTDFADICQLAQELEFGDEAQVVEALESLKAEGRIFEISEQPWLWSVDPVNSTTVEEVLEGDSPLNLSVAQIDELENALVGLPTPSIDDIIEEKPSAYAEEMAQRAKPGAKLRSLPGDDPRHKYSKKRIGVVRFLEHVGNKIYARVAEINSKGNDSRQAADYNLDFVEFVEDSPPILDFALPDVADKVGEELKGIEAEVFQFLTGKAAQASLYEGNEPGVSFAQITLAIGYDASSQDCVEDALDRLEERGAVTYVETEEGIGRWQIASEKPTQEEHSFKVGDRVTISGDSKGEHLIGKCGTLTAVSLTGCVLLLDGEDEKSRLFFCKEDLSPCSTFSQAA